MVVLLIPYESDVLWNGRFMNWGLAIWFLKLDVVVYQDLLKEMYEVVKT